MRGPGAWWALPGPHATRSLCPARGAGTRGWGSPAAEATAHRKQARPDQSGSPTQAAPESLGPQGLPRELRKENPQTGAGRPEGTPSPQRRDEATKIKQNEPLLNFSFFKDKDWKGPSRALSLRAPTPGRRGCHRPLRPRTGAAGARALRAPGRPRSSEAGQRREAAAGRVGTEPTVHKTHRARALPPLQKGSRSSRDTRRGGGGGLLQRLSGGGGPVAAGRGDGRPHSQRRPAEARQEPRAGAGEPAGRLRPLEQARLSRPGP